MILVTRLNGTEFMLNPELVEQIDKAPDTVITLTTGNNIIVRESAHEVAERILDYRKKVQQDKVREQGEVWTSQQ